MLIQVDNVSYLIDQNTILDKVSLNIDKNDFITIIGPNGAGKTSLVKIILGLIQPSSGKIHHAANLKIGYVPQSLNLSSNMPITAQVFLALNNNTQADIDEVMQYINIQHLAHKQLHVLSGGEKQKILLARAMLAKPQLIILDEPTQNLDIGSQTAFYTTIDKIHQQQNISILMISHELHIVMKQSNKVICLFHHICCFGKPDIVAQDPKFIELFGCDLAQNIALYKHNATHHCLHD